MEQLTQLLTPLTILISWSIFMLSSSVMAKFVALLFSSLALPLLCFSLLKLLWPCSLFLILMSTGLLVIFAYIVSLHSSVVQNSTGWVPLVLAACLMGLTSSLWEASPMIHHTIQEVYVEPSTSLILITLLLFLVVSLIRIVYSKGGGFRKKF